MNTLNFILGASLQPGDFTGFTFFIGSVSMLAATVFFLVQHGQVDKKFKDSMLVAALITGIAAVHYYYMRDQWAEGLGSPTELRYVDWILTVPLMVVEFALLTGVGMRKLFWASVVMLVTGYFGESGITGVGDAQIWGLISGLAYFYMAYEVGCLSIFGMGNGGEVGTALANAKGKIPAAGRMLQWFVLVGWSIYPLGYMIGTADGMWYSGAAGLPLDMDIVYNIGDAINKIGFGMAVWSAARD
jgi:bacteriorhodopsin|tara:strand:+ start:2575 stop:3306 length:732 start_codon:yes stop_codon:yes gene_type:complete